MAKGSRLLPLRATPTTRERNLMIELRKSITVISACLAALVGYVALTVPIVAMTGPLILALVLAAVAWAAWPK
jgi:hypothetical protein